MELFYHERRKRENDILKFVSHALIFYDEDKSVVEMLINKW